MRSCEWRERRRGTHPVERGFLSAGASSRGFPSDGLGAGYGFFKLRNINWFEQIIHRRIAKSAEGKLIGSRHKNDPRGQFGKNFQEVKTGAVAQENVEKKSDRALIVAAIWLRS